ncbi:MAG: GNAT family N-acetyltransferase [Tenericutes bacterium]|nr:GNAT family N-acetyltransferase [Mycoplasmatota bacterium]
MIELAKKEDIEEISLLAKKTRTHMLEMGLFQWIGDYPNQAHFLTDYNNLGLYIYKEDSKIIASITVLEENEEAYKEIVWKKNHSLVIHRMIVDPEFQKQGIAKQMFGYAIELGKRLNYESIKIDTHPDNYRMQALIKKMGFEDIGYLSGINRLAYERCI